MNVTRKIRLGVGVLGASICLAAALPSEALAQKKVKDYAEFAFDADKRKKTRRPLGPRLTYSGSIGISHLSESGIALDDAAARRFRDRRRAFIAPTRA